MSQKLKDTQSLPPQNLEAEESVLGSMMISADAIGMVVEQMHEKDFYRDKHRRIYAAIVDLFNQGEAVDPITVAEHLAMQGTLEQVGGRAYIHTLVSTVPAASNAAHYACIVRDNAVLRSLVEVGKKITELGYERTGEVAELLNRCEQMVFDISQRQTRGEFHVLEDILTEQFERIEKLHGSDKTVTGTPTGFLDLDKATSGFQPSNLAILAARPAMGKTSLALDFAQNIALREQVPVAIFSLEMSCADLVQRMMCTQGKVNSDKLRNGNVGPDDWAKLTDACGRLSKAPIYVDDTAGLNVLEIRSKTRRLASKHKLGLVIIDYMQLMMSDDTRAQNREQEVARISRSLKIMARELDVPVLAISQLSRAAESRNPPRPVLSDLRESGAIEQDADLVMFIYRPREEDGHMSNAAELIIAKHRHGPVSTIDLVFKKEYTSFTSMARTS